MDLKDYSEDRVNTEQILSVNPLENSREVISLSLIPTYPDHPDEAGAWVSSAPKPDYYLSRNAKGCIVATAANIAILDFDYENGAERSVQECEQHIIDNIEKLTVNYRLYRTAGGWRVILTDKLVTVKNFDFKPWERLGVDYLYSMLCLRFKNFRARISPKPERIGCQNLYEVFDTKTYLRSYWLTPEDKKQVMREWLAAYEKAANNFATCRLIKFRNDDPSPEQISKFVELHDMRTRAHLAYTLA